MILESVVVFFLAIFENDLELSLPLGFNVAGQQ